MSSRDVRDTTLAYTVGAVTDDTDAQHAVARLVAHRYRRGRETAAEALQVLAALGLVDVARDIAARRSA